MSYLTKRLKEDKKWGGHRLVRAEVLGKEVWLRDMRLTPYRADGSLDREREYVNYVGRGA